MEELSPVVMAASLDQMQLAKLRQEFGELSLSKQHWLLARFPNCNTDMEATKLCGEPYAKMTVDHWKRSDKGFRFCYDLMSSGHADWERHLAHSIEDQSALIAAIENRKLLLTPWGDVKSARESSAKATAINQTLERVVGKHRSLNEEKTVRVEELLPDRR